jgi:hypothetical protein
MTLGGLMTALLAISWTVSSAQRGASHYFPETGQTVEGDFWGFYESYPNPELIFGYPITPQFIGQFPDSEVQYFQRARFEQVSDGDAGTRVRLSPLGSLLYEPGKNATLPLQSSGCRTFLNPDDRSEYQVCFAFLEFFDAHGGIDVFGYPISNFEVEDQRIVQYFENAKLSWHPELPRGQKVQLADVGRLYFQKLGEDPNLTDPVIPYGYKNEILLSTISLKVRAFTDKAVVGDGEEQTLFVIVQNQNLQPVPEVIVKTRLLSPNGDIISTVNMPETDQNGVTQITIPVETHGEIGLAEFEVTANILNLEGNTITSFRLWW